MVLSAIDLARAEVGNVNRDEDLGKIVMETHYDEGESKVILDKEYSTEWEKEGGGEVSWEESETGQVDKNYVPVLPFSEEEARKKQSLELKYKDADALGLQIDSIEPEGGPMTGETRVLVRGGPFEDMSLLYPRPKCKFGANDRIVSATYVKCHERPLKTEDWEGKSKDKVSIAKKRLSIPHPLFTLKDKLINK